MKNMISTGLRSIGGSLEILDQTRLPQDEIWIEADEPTQMFEHIRSLRVRGAPLIGVAAALCMAKYAENGADRQELLVAADRLRNARPTAANLAASIDRLLPALTPELNREKLIRLAEAIFDEDVALCSRIGEFGAELIQAGDGILTVCNTGGLATAGKGTALAVIRRAFEQGKAPHVYVAETRPLLQGARLTTWELHRLGIPYTLVCDNMLGSLMRSGRVQRVITGADRVALNGDFANKIGTYGAAIMANHHRIPFYAAAPRTTVDRSCLRGEEIVIEERAGSEVLGACGPFGKVVWAPIDAKTWNPSFDVTPVELMTALILDSGLHTREMIRRGTLMQALYEN